MMFGRRRRDFNIFDPSRYATVIYEVPVSDAIVPPVLQTIYTTLSDSILLGREVIGFSEMAEMIDSRLTALGA